MKLFPLTLLPLAALAALSAAQNIRFRRPRPGASLGRDSPFPVIVSTPLNGTKLQELSLVLSILPCPKGTCPSTQENLGTILYAGPFQPTGGETPEQSFTVTIPGTFALGPAELVATHFVLVGDGHLPYLQLVAEYVYVDSD